MFSTEIIVKAFAEGVIKGIQDNIRNKQVTSFGAMNASGKMADSLGYSFDGKTLRIFSSEKFFTVLETGRGPSKGGGGGGDGPTLKESIEEWITDKPVALQGITKKSLAYLIAKGIHEKGTKLFQQGGKSGVISDYTNAAYIKENLTDKLFQAVVQSVTNEFLKVA